MEILNEDLVTVEHTLEDAVQRAVEYAKEMWIREWFLSTKTRA